MKDPIKSSSEQVSTVILRLLLLVHLLPAIFRSTRDDGTIVFQIHSIYYSRVIYFYQFYQHYSYTSSAAYLIIHLPLISSFTLLLYQLLRNRVQYNLFPTMIILAGLQNLIYFLLSLQYYSSGFPLFLPLNTIFILLFSSLSILRIGKFRSKREIIQ